MVKQRRKKRGHQKKYPTSYRFRYCSIRIGGGTGTGIGIGIGIGFGVTACSLAATGGAVTARARAFDHG